MQAKHVCMLPEQPFRMDLAPTAGWFRWQLSRLRQMMLPCERHHGTAYYIRSRKNLMLERERQMNSRFCIVWHPYSSIKIYWDSFQLLLNLLQFVYMPFQVFLVCPNRFDLFILFGDLMAFLDIGTKFITGYNEESNKSVILEPTKIALKYLRGTFLLDLIGCLPLQIYQPHKNCQYPTNTIMFIFKLAHLVSMNDQWTNMNKQLGLSYVTTVTIEIIVKCILFFHWMTYIHYQVPAFFSHYYGSETVWPKRFQLNWPYHNTFEKYTNNLYWATGLCVGAGYYGPLNNYIVPDLLLTSGVGIVGLIFIVYASTTCLRLFMYVTYDTLLYNGRLKQLEEYLAQKRIPMFLQNKIHLFLNYKFQGTYFNEDAILDTINEQIKQDINMHFCRRLVMNIPFFQDMPVAFVNTIIFSLVQILFMPGEVVVANGEPIDCLYMISSGTVAVLNSFGKEISHLRDGAYFGEDAMMEPTKIRSITIIALEITEMFKLSSEAYRACARPYPQLDQRLRTSSMERERNPRRRRRLFDE